MNFERYFDLLNSVKVKPNESCYAFITIDADDAECTVINAATERELLTVPFIFTKDFVEKLYFDNKKFSAIILDVYGYASREFCFQLKEKLNNLGIPNYFITEDNLLNSSVLTAANISVSYNETVLVVLSSPDDIGITELKFTPNGYEIIRTDEIADEKDPQKIREKILESSTPKKIIVLQNPSGLLIKPILKSKKLIVLNNDISVYREKFVVETCKWLLDKTYIKYYILPRYGRCCLVAAGFRQTDNANDMNGIVIAKLDHHDKLPFAETKIFPRSVLECWIGFTSEIETEPIDFCKLELKKNCHRFKFILNIDAESFETYEMKQIIFGEIKSLPKNLDLKMKTKIPVIGFFDNSSVVCINKDGNYQFSDNCGGLYGMDNFISFDEKKPKYGKAALTMMNEKASYVVFNLLMIMSMPKHEIKIDETCGFKITQNFNNPVLIEYDDCNNPGKRTAASPAFLMALLIKKQYFKAIKTETGGESPKEIGIWIYDQFDEDKMKRIKDGLEEACKLIKVKCIFVNC